MSADRYAVYIDISAKIEAWNKDSVIAVANGHTRALRITAQVKQLAARLVVSAEPSQAETKIAGVVTFSHTALVTMLPTRDAHVVATW